MYSEIRGMLFFEQLLEDGEIDPYSVDGRLHEDDGKFSDNATQFTTKTIKDTKDHDISDNIVDWPSYEEPSK